MRRRDMLKLLALSSTQTLVGADTAAATPRSVAGVTDLSIVADEPGRAFYLSPSGDDNATGRARETPWRTITHLNSQLTAGTVQRGDSVLFESGQTFYGKIRPGSGEAAGARHLTLGSYRSGANSARPTISSYKLLTNPAGWSRADASTWTIAVANNQAGVTHSGYDGAQSGGGNIGFLKVDGVIRGRRLLQLSELREQWDFYCAGDVLHVRSTDNPAIVASEIKAACDGDCIRLRDGLRVTGLRLEGSGGHGIEGSATGVRVEDTEFAELGGSLLNPTTRYGNGFQAWIDSADVVVERSIFHDIYDAALTAQGGPTTSTGSWSNITFRNNLVYSCNQSVEFWSDGKRGGGPGFVNCLVECNTCLYAGYGWSAAVRPDRDTRVHLLTYGWALPADIIVRRNTFYDGFGAYRYSSTATPGLVCTDNLVYQRGGGLIKFGDPQTVEQWRDWVAVQRNDLGSTFAALPDETGAVDVPGALRRVADNRPGCSPPALPER